MKILDLDTKTIEEDPIKSKKKEKETNVSYLDKNRTIHFLIEEINTSFSPSGWERMQAGGTTWVVPQDWLEGYRLFISGEILAKIWKSMADVAGPGSSFQVLFSKDSRRGCPPSLEMVPVSAERVPVYAKWILSAVEEEPVESGYVHGAEEILTRWEREDPEGLRDWLYSIVEGGAKPSMAASVLTCYGRIKEGEEIGWEVDLLRGALKHPDLEVREAAVRVLEIWGKPEVLPLLEEQEGEEPVEWLREYIGKVLEDLSGV